MDDCLTTDYGESSYGHRLNYSKPKYRDVWAGIAYCLQVLIIIAICGYLWFTQVHKVNKDSTNSTMATLNPTGIFVTLILCMTAGTFFGLIWLQIIKRWAGTIIKAMLFINISMWVILVIVGVINNINIPLIVIGAILALVWSLYTWCVWRRIPFASALLSISSNIVQTYPATIFVSLTVIVLQTLWIFLWSSAFIAYIIVSENKKNTNKGIIFLLLISLYWGLQVNKNVSHTTTCGVAATWYFSTPETIRHPTASAFKRTVTTSFGSVALGSLIVAFLEALRAMVSASRNSKNGLCVCLALCLLSCIERMIRYFNQYAYAQVAIYGSSFWQSAKATWDLFHSRGMMAIINDDLSGMALMAGAFLGFIVSGLVGYFVGVSFYSSGDWYPTVPIGLAIIGAIIGFIFCMAVLLVIRSSIVCLFVCYSEDPSVMAINRPNEYQRISEAKAEWANVYNSFGGGHQPREQHQVVNAYQQQEHGVYSALDDHHEGH